MRRAASDRVVARSRPGARGEEARVSDAAKWDAICIGSGIGALAAAAALADRGKRVLVLERLANFGGAATVYRHGPLTMEAALHETDGDTVHGAHSAFARLGLAGEVAPIETDIFYEVRSDALPRPLQAPHGLGTAREALKLGLPGAAPALDAYFDELDGLYAALGDLEEMGARGPSALLGLLFSGRLFKLMGYAHQTLAQKFDAIFGADEAPKLALGAPLGYFDDDPAQLSFLLFAGVWARYVESGSYYFRGGSRALTMALVGHVKRAGGEARHRCSVVSLVLDGQGRAAGVVYEDAAGERREAIAPVLFAGAAPDNVAEMLPQAARADFAQRYARFEPSISLFNVSLGLSRPAAEFGVSAYSTFTYPDGMRRFADWPQAAAVFGQEPSGALPPYVIADYGRLDAGLRGADDPYLVSLCGVDRLAWWDGLDEAAEMTRRKRWLDALIADVDRRFRGFAGAVTQAEIATARTMKNRLGTPHGEVYGFRATPARLFSRPPSAATSVPGLWLSSAYTVGGGFAGAMQGGLIAADGAMRAARRR
jgi:phytoene dehydrogenase-like protein